MIKDIISRSTVLFDLYQQRKNKARRDFLTRNIPQGGIGAELGVFRGNFSTMLLDVLKPQKLHIVDPWYRMTDRWHWGPGNRSTVEGLVATLRRNASHLFNKTVELHVDDSVSFLKSMPNAYFDWIYIDSSHEYKHTLCELKAASTKIKPGGVICGDDWHSDTAHRHHGVYKAVQEFCGFSQFKVSYGSNADKQWALQNSSTLSKVS